MLTIVRFAKTTASVSFWKPKTLQKSTGSLFHLETGTYKGSWRAQFASGQSDASAEADTEHGFTCKLKIKPFEASYLVGLCSDTVKLGWFYQWCDWVLFRGSSLCPFQERAWAMEAWLLAFSWLLWSCPGWLFLKEISPSLSVLSHLQGCEVSGV